MMLTSGEHFGMQVRDSDAHVAEATVWGQRFEGIRPRISRAIRRRKTSVHQKEWNSVRILEVLAN